MMIKLPKANAALQLYTLRDPPRFTKPRRLESRTVYAAAHVVADPLGENCLVARAALDWESTLAFRHHLWALGLGVAEAMDTAQRGMGLDWATTQELIRRSAAAAKLALSPIACGAGTSSGCDVSWGKWNWMSFRIGCTMQTISRLNINQYTVRNWDDLRNYWKAAQQNRFLSFHCGAIKLRRRA